MASIHSPALKHGAALFLFVTLLTVNVSAASFDWQSPVDVSAGENPKEYASSPQNLFFQVDLGNVNSDGTITLQRKSSDLNSFADVESLAVKNGADGYRNNHNYVFGESRSFVLEEYTSKTISVDGAEHTFYVGNVNPTDNWFASMEIDGLSESSDEPGMIFNETLQDKRRIKVTETFENSTSQYIRINLYDRISVSSDYWQYRAKVDSSDYSESIYFSVGKGHNLPYLDFTEINSDRIYDFNTTQNRITNSDVYANVKDDETNTYNVTLYDASDDHKVAEIQTGSDFKTMFAYAISDFFSLGDLTREDHFFTTSSDSFLSQTNTAYSYYFEVEDLNDGGSRLTPVFQLNTGSATNTAPTISSVEYYDGSAWNALNENISFGASIEKIRVKVDDPDNDFHQGYLNIRNEYDGETFIGNSSNPVNGSEWDYLDSNNDLIWNVSSYDFSRILDSGDWVLDIQVTDYNSNESKSDSWSYPHNEPSITQNLSKTSVERNNTFKASSVISCSQYECINENESIKDYLDPVKISKEPQLLSLEYWQSWIRGVFV